MSTRLDRILGQSVSGGTSHIRPLACPYAPGFPAGPAELDSSVARLRVRAGERDSAGFIESDGTGLASTAVIGHGTREHSPSPSAFFEASSRRSPLVTSGQLRYRGPIASGTESAGWASPLSVRSIVTSDSTTPVAFAGRHSQIMRKEIL
jgi:hypothetical protein